MTGRSPALKAITIRAAMTAMLMAPMVTGLRSRNGVLMRALPSVVVVVVGLVAVWCR